MYWIMQKNLFNEKGYIDLANILSHTGIEHCFVKPVPFTNFLISEDYDASKAMVDLADIPKVDVSTTKPIYVCGSYTLAKIAKDREWVPGSFLKNLSYDIWSKAWAANKLLNPGAIITDIGSAMISETSFIRPVEDSKTFAGTVFSPEEFSSWKNKVMSMSSNEPLHSDVEITISRPVNIFTETRFFVVDSKIATASEYKRGSRVVYSRNVDSAIYDYARDCIAEWTPDKAFVLDIADTPDGFKIIEVNNINSCGFYDCDISKIVFAIEDMGEKYYG